MFDFLRALALHPMEWGKAVLAAKGANPHVDAILDAAMEKAVAVVVLFSPDEEARLKEHLCARGEHASEGRLSGQPRPNVLFEAGLALGRHAEKTLIAQVGHVRPFSDIAGKHLVHLTNQVQSRIDFVNRLERICPSLDRKGSDWTSTGDFAPSQSRPR
jgi:predicted nucleotide-binding protein